jgi:hypothetical protein
MKDSAFANAVDANTDLTGHPISPFWQPLQKSMMGNALVCSDSNLEKFAPH